MEATDIRNDARFEEAKKLMKKGEYEDAIGLFSSLLQSRVEEFGELSIEAAQAYYEYGNALLVQQEENPSDNLLGSSDAEKQEEFEEVGNEDDEEGANNEDAEKDDDDLQIAWENLDVARLVLEKNCDGQERLLSSVYIRLGDLMRLEERPGEALCEYQKALVLREKICRPDDRELCDVNFCLAAACVDLSSKVEGEEVSAKKQEALEYYRRARSVLQLQIATADATDHAADVQDLIDILTESVDALHAELLQLRNANGSSSSFTAPVTTIGFGNSSSSSGHDAKDSDHIVKKRPAEQISSSDVQVLQIKKKPKEG